MYLRLTTFSSLLGLILTSETSQAVNLTITNVQAATVVYCHANFSKEVL
jgi:hypothetical protein